MVGMKVLFCSPVKAGEDNPQACEEEAKLVFIKKGVQLISGWNPQNVGIRILWESYHCHLPLPACAPSAVFHSLCLHHTPKCLELLQQLVGPEVVLCG